MHACTPPSNPETISPFLPRSLATRHAPACLSLLLTCIENILNSKKFICMEGRECRHGGLLPSGWNAALRSSYVSHLARVQEYTRHMSYH